MRPTSKLLCTTAGILATVAALITGGLTAAAHAETVDAQRQQVTAELRQRLTDLQVTSQAQDKIIANFLRGELPQSDTGNATSVSTRTFAREGGEVTRHTYADGSIAETTVEQATDADQARTPGIENCTKEVKDNITKFRNCTVWWTGASWHMNYKATYGYYQFGNFVEKIHAANVEGVGSFTVPLTELNQPTCNTSCTSWGRATSIQKVDVGVEVTTMVGVKISINNQTKTGKSAKV